MKKYLSNSSLKIIAIISMVVDHTCLMIINSTLANRLSISTLDDINIYGRHIIGRLAFPIFCFLLVEGFVHTKDAKKYLIRLGVFALISEIPFDLFASNQIFNLAHQNVFFTLFIGLATLMLLKKYKNREGIKIIIVLSSMLIAALTMVDYGALGIILILLLNLARKKSEYLIVCGAAIFLLNPAMGLMAFVSFFLIILYNEKKGLPLKYSFYVFYPVHLLILYLIGNYLIK